MSRFEFVKQHTEKFDVEELCEALEVSRSGYYLWTLERKSARVQVDEQIKAQIQSICQQAGGLTVIAPCIRIWSMLVSSAVGIARCD